MTSTLATERGLSPELRASLYSLTTFFQVGVAVTYSGTWFAQHGLKEDQIGIINSASVAVMLLINIFVGKIADWATDWRTVIIIGSILSPIFAAGLFYSNTYLPILIFWSATFLCYGVIGAVVDAANSRMTARRGTSYGAVRAWATVGYVGAVYLAGQLLSKFGSEIFIPLIVGAAALRGFASLILPKFRSDEKTTAIQGSATHLKEMFRPWLFLPLMAWAIIQSTNIAFMAFQAKFFGDQGIPQDMISNSIAVGAIGEAAVMFLYPWFKRKFSPMQLILAAGLTAIFRWICFAYAPGIMWLFPLQALNAITYGVGFLGIMAFITAWTAEDIAAEAQSFMGVLQQIAAIIMVTGFGYIAKAYGVQAFWSSAAMAALGVGVLIYASLMAPHPTTAPARS